MQIILDKFSPFSKMRDSLGTQEACIDCYTMAELTILQNFNISPLRLLNNFNFIYKFLDDPDKKSPGFTIRNPVFEDRINIMQQLGIEIEGASPKLEDLMDYIKYNISNKLPILMLVDIFYQEGRYYYYNNLHGIHLLLIYGFDDDEKKVYTIDNVLGKYMTYIISYDTIMQYCKGVFEFCNHKKGEVYCYTYKQVMHMPDYSKEDLQEIFHEFACNMLKKKEERDSALSSIQLLSKRVDEMLPYKRLEENILNVRNKRYSEYFRIKNLCEYNLFNEDVVRLLEEYSISIIGKWKKMRNIIVHYNLRPHKFSTTVQSIRMIADEIYQEEKKYGSVLYEELTKIYDKRAKVEH